LLVLLVDGSTMHCMPKHPDPRQRWQAAGRSGDKKAEAESTWQMFNAKYLSAAE